MPDPNTDTAVLQTITQLVHEEQTLYRQENLADRDVLRLAEIKATLDQYWDLLRQREALREFGRDPDTAKIRPVEVVEKYEQ